MKWISWYYDALNRPKKRYVKVEVRVPNWFYNRFCSTAPKMVRGEGLTMAKSKLPEVEGYMKLAEGLFLEVMHALVDTGALTEEQALSRYKKAKKKYKGWKNETD